MTSQEDLAAENVLKRAELARISRQLKSRLSKTNFKIKDRTSPLKSSSPIKVKITTPKKLFKKKSAESFDLNKTEDEEEFDDNSKNIQQMPPSSPIYEEFAIPTNPPSTPPQQKIHINSEIYNTASTNKTYIQTSSSPAVLNRQQKLLSTPDHQKHHDEGADLLMFLATSPSPVQYKQPPSTPSRSIASKLTQTSSIQRLGNSLSNNQIINATPGTPMRNLLKTPGFNMNDYVNIFTPSPGHLAKTPEQFSKDVNGKLIKF